VRIYAIGIGEAGKQEPVTTVMVLDRSGSMLLPAEEQDQASKIDAMRNAAARFVNSIGPTARSSVLEFSDAPKAATPFVNDKFALKAIVRKIQGFGETAVFDAVYDAVETLEAERAPGKRAVVALTDGIDNSSRRRVEEVIERAREAKIPLYLLGFGRPGELDETVMKEMAAKTNGEYYHAKNEKALLEIFEKLSQQIHEDGIDEVSLRKLASVSGGQYYHAQDVSRLHFILEQVTKTLQRKEYEVTFASLLPKKDGTVRNIGIKLIRRSGELAAEGVGGSYRVGEEVLEERQGGYQVKGLVLAEMNHFVYLLFLAGLGVLILLPAIARRMFRPAA
jgi:VWFA-related protein